MTADDLALELAGEIDTGLRRAGTPERAEGERRYLKSDLAFYGVPVGDTRTVVRRAVPTDLDHATIVALVTHLWDEPHDAPVYDRRRAAVEVLVLAGPKVTIADVPLVERLLREARTWALVDELAIVVVGGLAERDPALGDVLDRWVTDDDFWLRRTALLALLRPLRAGGGDWERFARDADALLEEREFFVRKAIGWVLRDTSRRRPDLVATWIAPRTARASGVTMREVVRHLPEPWATGLTSAHREHRPAVLPPLDDRP